MDHRPAFLELADKDLADWRSHPVTKLLLEWFAWEADQSNYSCADLLRKGETKRALSVAGRALAWEEAIGECMRKDPPAEVPSEPFYDQSYRFNPGLSQPIIEGKEDAGTD